MSEDVSLWDRPDLRATPKVYPSDGGRLRKVAKIMGQAEAVSEVPEHITDLLEELKTAIEERGLVAEVHGVSWSLVAKNPANSHLTQRVTLAEHGAGLAWYWSFDGDDEGTHERICPAPAVAEVCTRLSRVVSLHRIAPLSLDGYGGNSGHGGSI